MLANIRLGGKVTDSKAYYDRELFTAVRNFIVQIPRYAFKQLNQGLLVERI